MVFPPNLPNPGGGFFGGTDVPGYSPTNLAIGNSGVLEDGKAAREVSFKFPTTLPNALGQFVVTVRSGTTTIINRQRINGPYITGQTAKVWLHGLPWNANIAWEVAALHGFISYKSNGPSFSTGNAPVNPKTLEKLSSYQDQDKFWLNFKWVRGAGPHGILEQVVDVSRDREFKVIDHAFPIATDASQALVSWPLSSGEKWYVRINERFGEQFWLPSTSTFEVEQSVVAFCEPPTGLTYHETLGHPVLENDGTWTFWVQWMVPNSSVQKFYLSLLNGSIGQWVVFDFPINANPAGTIQEVPLRGLVADNTFRWFVSSDCGDGQRSSISEGPNIRFEVDCDVPTDLGQNTDTVLQPFNQLYTKWIRWRVPSPLPQGFYVTVRNVTDGNQFHWNKRFVQGAFAAGDMVNDFPITDLLPGKTYDWAISTVCAGAESETVVGFSFTTPTVQIFSNAKEITVVTYILSGQSTADIKWRAPTGGPISSYFMDFAFANTVAEAQAIFDGPTQNYVSINLNNGPFTVENAGNGFVQIRQVGIRNENGSPITVARLVFLRITNQFTGQSGWFISPIASFQPAIVGGTGGPLQKNIGDLMAVIWEFDYKGPATVLNLLQTVRNGGFNEGQAGSIGVNASSDWVHYGPAQTFVQVGSHFPGGLYSLDLVMTNQAGGGILAHSNPGDYEAIWNV